MPATDTSEKGLEGLIVASLVGSSGAPTVNAAVMHDKPVPGAAAPPHYVAGNSNDYDRDHAVDLSKLLTEGMLVAEIGEPAPTPVSMRQRELIEQPLPRVQRVFTMPLDELCALWSDTAESLRSQQPGSQT